MILVERINMLNPLYEFERELRNEVLLRPDGIEDNSFEMYDDKAWHFVALDSEKVVGCVLLVPNGNKSKAQIIQVAVDKEHQENKIGKKLIEKLVNFSKAEGIRELLCNSKDSVVNFYSNYGFEVYGDQFIDKGSLHMPMKLSI